MLIKLLDDSSKKHLINLARLLSLSDNSLLYGDKLRGEISEDEIDFYTLSIQEDDQERELILELELSAGLRSNSDASLSEVMKQVVEAKKEAHRHQARLIEEITKFGKSEWESDQVRAQAAISVLKKILGEKSFSNPAPPKIILFELILVALRDGNISNIEWALLKEFQKYHQLDDFIFDDLLERAEALNQEVSKTISIVLE